MACPATQTLTVSTALSPILLVMPQANLGGGAEVMLLNFLLGARQVHPGRRFPIIFLRPGPFIDLVRAHGFEVCATLDVRLRRPWSCFWAFTQLCRWIKKLKAKAVLSWVAYGHLLGGLAAFWNGVPAIWYQIGFASGWMDQVASRVPADRILAVSNHIAERQRLLGARCPIIPILPGIDLGRFGVGHVDDLRAQLRLPSDARIAVLVGRLQRWKGIHTAIAAMPRILAAVPNARLIIVGGPHDLEPEYARALIEQVNQSGARQAIALVGRQDNVADWMRAADVVVHASSGEPFGIVAVEGMACGRPLVTGSDGGVVEAVRDGVEGIHVPFEDTEHLADALILLFQNPLLAQRMGQLGAERAKLFTRERYALAICSELNAVTAKDDTNHYERDCS